MNHYGEIAMKHWERWRPQAFSTLKNPKQFFTNLGNQVQEQIDQAVEQISVPPAKDYMQQVGQLNAIKQQIVEQVLAEMVYLPVETNREDMDLVNENSQLETPDGMPADPNHPLWAMEADPEVSVSAYRQALQQWRASLPPRNT